MTWQDDAACSGKNPNIFFPERGDSLGMARAKAICATCTVTAACLQRALDESLNSGVHGGLSAKERRLLKATLPKPQRIPEPIRHGTEGGARTHRRRGEKPCSACAEAALIAKQARKRKDTAV